MLSMEELGLVQSLKNKNMQSSFDSNDNYFEEEPDWKLAYIFTNYLSGKEDILPTFEFINDLEKEAKRNIISLGYGMSISKEMKVSIEEPITSNIIRRDVITPKSYKAYEYNINTDSIKDIDITKYPRYKIDRINKLMMYLESYRNRFKEEIEELDFHK